MNILGFFFYLPTSASRVLESCMYAYHEQLGSFILMETFH